jgi:hypothetical protein
VRNCAAKQGRCDGHGSTEIRCSSCTVSCAAGRSHGRVAARRWLVEVRALVLPNVATGTDPYKGPNHVTMAREPRQKLASQGSSISAPTAATLSPKQNAFWTQVCCAITGIDALSREACWDRRCLQPIAEKANSNHASAKYLPSKGAVLMFVILCGLQYQARQMLGSVFSPSSGHTATLGVAYLERGARSSRWCGLDNASGLKVIHLSCPRSGRRVCYRFPGGRLACCGGPDWTCPCANKFVAKWL